MIQGHGGNVYGLAERLGCRPDEIADVSSNINPLGPPPGVLDHLREQMDTICALPEVDSRTIEMSMARYLEVDPRSVVAGAGTTQFIYAMFGILASRRVLIVGPTYADYADACRLAGMPFEHLLATPEDRFRVDLKRIDGMARRADTVVICNPNNPTGVLLPGSALLDLCRRYPETRFVIDESYLGFVPDADAVTLAACGLDNVLVLHSFSKLFRLPGLRIGFLIAAAALAERFRSARVPWSLNTLSQAAVSFITTSIESTARFVAESRAYIIRERTLFFDQLRGEAGLKLYPSRTTFFLVELPAGVDAPTIWERFARERVLVRDCSNFFGLGERFIRIAVNQPDVNRKVVGLLSAMACRRGADPLKKNEALTR